MPYFVAFEEIYEYTRVSNLCIEINIYSSA